MQRGVYVVDVYVCVRVTHQVQCGVYVVDVYVCVRVTHRVQCGVYVAASRGDPHTSGSHSQGAHHGQCTELAIQSLCYGARLRGHIS